MEVRMRVKMMGNCVPTRVGRFELLISTLTSQLMAVHVPHLACMQQNQRIHQRSVSRIEDTFLANTGNGGLAALTWERQELVNTFADAARKNDYAKCCETKASLQVRQCLIFFW